MGATGLAKVFKEIVRAPIESALKVYLSTLPLVELQPSAVRSILLFAYHGLGNFIMYTPALKLLRETFPQARIDLQVGNNTGNEEVLAGSGLFDNIYNLPIDAGVAAWLKRMAEVRRTGYDLTINEFHSHSWRLAMTVLISGAPYRVGHVTSPGWSRRFSRFSFIFNIPVAMREDEHEVERYLDLVASVGANRLSLSDAKPEVHLDSADREFAERFFNEANGNGGRVIGVQPGTSATMRWKQWPIERYRTLIERLLFAHPESCIVLFGSRAEVGMISEMAKHFGDQVKVAAGKTTIKQVAALIEHCDVLVCNDSGLMHVAVAVGTPVVAIYGPTDIRRTAPLGARHTVIRHSLPCSPCFKLEGDEQPRLCPHHDCLMTISPDEVFEAITMQEGSVPLSPSRRVLRVLQSN